MGPKKGRGGGMVAVDIFKISQQKIVNFASKKKVYQYRAIIN